MPINPNVGDIVATTLRDRSGVVADNVTKSNALLITLQKRGNVKPTSGGRTLFEEIAYAENGTFKRYSGYDPLNIQPSNVLSAAEFDLKQAAVSVSMSGLEQLQNSGSEQVLDLLEQRIENAEATLMNNIAADVYSDGTADGGRQIGGLQLLIADTPTSGTVGGIDRSLYPIWRNQSFDATTDGGAPASATNIVSYMNQVYVRCTRGADKPGIIIADNNYYLFYLNSQQTIVRHTNQELLDAGFDGLSYNGIPVILDGGNPLLGGSCPANHMYFANPKYIKFRPHSDRNFAPLEGGTRRPINQDAMVQFMAFAGNMTLRGATFQGVLKD